jgi:hypothetical protein
VSQILGHNQSIIPNQCSSRSQNSLLSIGSQRNIARACMSSVERPLCLPVADNEDPWSRHGGVFSSPRATEENENAMPGDQTVQRQKLPCKNSLLRLFLGIVYDVRDESLPRGK